MRQHYKSEPTRHRCDVTEKLLKATLNPNKQNISARETVSDSLLSAVSFIHKIELSPGSAVR